ncbi:hypothetical protein H8B09_07640 [Paenibacillus sp. PR3]|uniref:DUF4359 domain-containing protein n=1 Tax=Paenibacillus terricola TaxID=2763503 RepID=A0ABR8MRL2_9BACL|nr:hypothetical protein [Paenibacillus terricola]MBD3918617.1 hypothetical protein [Paenibacillus terricola]
MRASTFLNKLLIGITILAIFWYFYSLIHSNQRYQLLQEQTDKTFQRQLAQVGECFGQEMDETAFTRCIAAVTAAASISHLTSFTQTQDGETLDFIMNQFINEMYIPANKTTIIDHQGELNSLFFLLARDPADKQLTKQLKDFVGSLNSI